MTTLLEKALQQVHQLPEEKQDEIAGLLLHAIAGYQPDGKAIFNRSAGSAAGRIWIADDFEAPLDDFQDYQA